VESDAVTVEMMLRDEQFIAVGPDVASSPVGSGVVWEPLARVAV
jgi:hypothetical protein